MKHDTTDLTDVHINNFKKEVKNIQFTINLKKIFRS